MRFSSPQNKSRNWFPFIVVGLGIAAFAYPFVYVKVVEIDSNPEGPLPPNRRVRGVYFNSGKKTTIHENTFWMELKSYILTFFCLGSKDVGRTETSIDTKSDKL